MKGYLLMICIMVFGISHAQLRIRKADTDLKYILEQVLIEYPGGFHNLKSEVLSSSPQWVEYSTTLKFKSSEETSVYQYTGNPPVYSWKALLLTTEDYDAARKKYIQYCNELKGMQLTIGGGAVTVDGKVTPPNPNLRFTGTRFTLDPAIEGLRFKIEVSMQYVLPEWKVQLQVFEKEREDDEAPSAPKTKKGVI